jgi:hypothetical protein
MLKVRTRTSPASGIVKRTVVPFAAGFGIGLPSSNRAVAARSALEAASGPTVRWNGASPPGREAS